MRRDSLTLTALLALATSTSFAAEQPPHSANPPRAEAAVDAMLAAMGGREAWADARGYRVEAMHYLAEEARPFRNEILLDFREPRLRIRGDRADGPRINIIDLDGVGEPAGWRLVEGRPVAMTEQERTDQRAWWHANVYRSLHRLARRDPALGVGWTEDGRLRVLEDGQSLLWFRLNHANEPVAFGSGNAAAADATIFGPLVQYDSLKFPSFSVRDGGRWRAIIVRFDVDPALDDAQFDERAMVR